MQNPFTRLKHYKPDLIHPKENHATECLAACLQFSDEVRESFVQFLFQGMAVKPPSTKALEVSTQQSTGDFGIPDLVLEEGRCRIAVEVKVDDQLTESQAKRYGKWLMQDGQSGNFLFSLEKEQRNVFDIARTAGVPGARQKWRTLYDWLRFHEKSFDATSAKLVASLCFYLEDEGIVSTWKPSQILAYGPGLRAKDALSHCFARVADELQSIDPKFETVERMPVREWPRLEVAHPDWKQIFGTGYLGRIWCFYETEGVWESSKSGFYFCIFTWNGYFASDWALTQSKLKKWAETLAEKGFGHTTSFKRGKDIEGPKGLEKLTQTPTAAEAWIEDDNRSYIDATKIEKLSDEQLVKEITERILELSKAVSALG